MNKSYLSSYIVKAQDHRIEAIYNLEYRYIKEIIWDTEKEELYGLDREGYNKFKREDTETYNTSYSGVVSLRTNTNKANEIIGYITEEKKPNNKSLEIMYEILEEARIETLRLIGITDVSKDLEYFLAEYIDTDILAGARIKIGQGPNECISSIRILEDFLQQYNEDEDLRSLIKKLNS